MLTVGIDEVGRGCWAGPLVAGAVVLNSPIAGLKDSKRLSKRQRERLALQVHDQALAVGLGWVSPADIDAYGLSWAVKTAMQRALQAVLAQTSDVDEIVIDGSINYLPADSRARALIKADDSIAAVSAASIIAKVARDTYMCQLDNKYEAYGFDRHVGYGTLVHRLALAKFGVSDIHRLSFKPVKAVQAACP